MDSTSSPGATSGRLLGVVPFSDEFLGGGLFDEGGALDRDGGLAPWRALRTALMDRGWDVRTIDQVSASEPAVWLHLDSFGPPPPRVDLRRTILIMWEPEVVAPYWYARSRTETLPFPIVYTHTKALTERGMPYRYLHWPQALPPWSPDVGPRPTRLVMINGRKYPAVRRGELYSTRERVAAWFARRGKIEIYGSGWTGSSVRHPISGLRTPALRRAYCGRVESKFDVLRTSEFAVCFENMRERGFRTEKLFDVLCTGTIPVYLGDPDITEVVEPAAFVDYASIGSPQRLDAYLDELTQTDREEIRAAGQRSLASSRFAPYTVAAFTDRMVEVVEEVTAHA